ncbi:hypothetical protein GE061_006404 [Apolygus lucorum]|uniref:Uncharacterized protein n=1 Tax=Apolygus lucorum TaxID=248454 RepID=A0A8S9WTU1_APOLU|nr:hypothetical protein GE061_006404 [Apolygus lucorum]
MEDLSESLEVNISNDANEDKESRASDGSWKDDEERRDSWVDTGPLSEELRLLDEEHKRQLEEARQWLEEEEAADEMLRRDLDELQIAEQRNHELSARLIAPEPEIPPEVQERLDLLEKSVKSLQEQLGEKASKLNQRNESYSELLVKFNSMTERLLSTDQDFKITLARVKEEYEDLEGVLRGKMKNYQDLNKQLELALNEKEAEISDMKDKLAEYDTMKDSFSELQNKLEDTNKSVDHLNKMTIKLKERLKSIRNERDSLLKERESIEPVEPLKQKIAELETERVKLLEEQKTVEDVELLKNRITLLEEEKGNLQLQLVDLDELKESAESGKLLLESLEKEKSELQSTLQIIKEQHAELINGKETAKQLSDEQEAVISKLKKALQEVTEEKIASVMRSVELEELLTAKEKEISKLKDSLRILEAEKVETSKQAGERGDGDSELLSDYNVSNGLAVKLTVLENELEDCKERERVLTVTVSELQNLRVELESKLHAVLAERENMRIEEANVIERESQVTALLAGRDSVKADLEGRLSAALQNLSHQEQLTAELQERLSSALSENAKLSKTLSELPKESVASASASGASEPDTTTQKLKKLAAMYKKKCGELENEIEQLKATLTKRADDCSILASERSCLEHDVLNSASRYQQSYNEVTRLENELAELYAFINEFKNLPLDRIIGVVDPSKVRDVLTSLSAWSSRTGVLLPPSVYVPPVADNDASKIEELQAIIVQNERVIDDLEKDKNHLKDMVTANEVELKMLKELYEKESGKNEQFYADLMGLESEMSQSKSDLINRLDEVTSALQGRENYIEILEQDIVNMKSKMYSIESGMDDRHRELKDRAQMMINKLQEAEMMTATFDKYKVQVEKKIAALEESEADLKDRLINAQVQLEESQEEASATKLRNSILEKEKSELECQINEIRPELQTLRDIRSAYNNTLDEIEKLNGGLKEAMEGFEAKSEKLILLESEREVLINKLTDLEDAFGDLEKKLEESDGINMSFRSQVEMLSRQLEESKANLNESQQELNNVRLSQAGNELLAKEMSELTGSYEEKIQVLVTAKNKLEELLLSKGNEVGFLQSNLRLMEEELDRVRQWYESRINVMEADSHQQLQSVMSELETLRQSQQENAAAGRAEEASRVQVEPVVQSIQTSPVHGDVRRLASGDSMENPFADVKDEEDGWGWMGAESMMPEVEAPQPQESSRIADLTNTIQQLQIERDTSVQQLEAMKINYKKVLKKLKDMKAEQAKVDSSKGGFSDLDLVLQEELRSENDVLRGKMSELSKQFESLKKEKEMLTKRVDTLTSANEQLVDMKERQDIEVQMWQKRSSELSNQVQNLQWSLEALRSENPTANDPELSLKLIALGAENDELKGVLLGKKDEINQAIAREQDLEQEIQDLKESLSKLELAVANTSKPVSSEATPIASAAVLFQGATNSDPQLTMKLDALTVENDELKKELLHKKEEINQAVENHRNREYDLQLEIQNLQGSLRNLEKSLSDVEKPVVKETSPVASAAVLFQGTAAAFDDVFSWGQQSVPQSVEIPGASIEELIKQKAALEADVSRIQREHESLQSDKDQLEHRVSYLWEQNAELLKRIEEQNAFPDEEQAYYDEQVKELEQNFQKALLERDEDNAHLVCTISAKEQSLKNVTQELQSLRDKYKNLGELQEKLQEYQNENGNLKSEVEALKNYVDVSRESSEIEHVSTIQTLMNQNSALKEANSLVNGELSEKKEELQVLTQAFKEKEAEILVYQEKLAHSMRQIDELRSSRNQEVDNSQVLAEIESLSGMVADYEITIKNQMEQLSDKDRIIVELQNEIRCLQSVSESTRYDFGDGEETLRSSIGFLEQERLRLEDLVQERLSEVAKYEVEIEELRAAQSKPQKEDVATYLAMIEEKDAEINRLTKSVVDIQERLLLSEQGKLHPDLRSVQAKLDQALYHLHSRDVKIEELTMEIIQLLEERDSLQFRLSDALRRTAEPSKENLPKSPMQDKTNTDKLNELHGGYKKDPVVQTEREARHVQHMQLYSEDTTANKEDSIVDYGIFNWFFGGSSSPAPQVGVNDGS